MKRFAILLILLSINAFAIPTEFDPRIQGWYQITDDDVHTCSVFGGTDTPIIDDTRKGELEVDAGGIAQPIDIPTETVFTIQAIKNQTNGVFNYYFEYFIEPIQPTIIAFFLEAGAIPDSSAPSAVIPMVIKTFDKKTFANFTFTSPAQFHSVTIAYPGQKITVPFTEEGK